MHIRKITGFTTTALPVAIALSLTVASASTVIHIPSASSPATKATASRPAIVGGVYISGGASLPAIAYDGGGYDGAGYINHPGTNLTAPAGTVLKYWGQPFSYCPTGSGFGLSVLAGAVAANEEGCSFPSAPFPPPPGFTTAAQAFADFVGSEIPISNTEYSTFLTNARPGGANIGGRLAPVQVPYIAGAIAFLYFEPSFPRVVLSPTTICGIASGDITNWNEIPVNPANPTGTKYGNQPLTFVYRRDSSGTTFALSNYLSRPGGCVQNFGLNSVFNDSNTSVMPPPTTQVFPTNTLPPKDARLIGVNGGDAAVSQVIRYTPGAIGYVEAANAQAAVAAAGEQSYFNFANIGMTLPGKSPIADLPAAANTIQYTAAGYVLSPFVNNGRPSPDIETLAAAGITPPNFHGTTTSTGPCLAIVDPKNYDNPSAGYPIIAISNLDFSVVGNGTTGSTQLQKLAGYLDNNLNVGAGKITSVDRSNAITGTTGYSNLVKLGASSQETTAIKCIHA